MTSKIKTGEIWIANLNPSKGREPGKTRPVVVIQDQALLDAVHPTTLIMPLTTQLEEDMYPLRVRVRTKGKLEKNSDILVDQLRAIDNNRFMQGPLTKLSAQELHALYSALIEVTGMANVC